MMADDIPRYDYSTIVSVADPTALIHAMERGLISADVVAPERAHHDFGNGTLLLMPAWRGGGVIAVKVATVIAGNAACGLPTVQGEVLLICAETGRILASLDGAAVTQLRTAAVAALAVKRLAIKPVDSILVLGTGALIPHILAAARAVRPEARFTIWGRNAVKAAEIVESADFLHLVAATDLAEAVRNADVVIGATAATSPLVASTDLKLNALLVLMGGFRPDMYEAEATCFKDALVVIDTPDALKEAGDLLGPIKRGLLDPVNVIRLDNLLTPPAQQISKRVIFKSVGSARFDLIAAEYLYRSLLDAPRLAPDRDNLI